MYLKPPSAMSSNRSLASPMHILIATTCYLIVTICELTKTNAEDNDTVYFSVERSLIYEGFADDFGPLISI